jgi:hypothetical protein
LSISLPSISSPLKSPSLNFTSIPSNSFSHVLIGEVFDWEGHFTGCFFRSFEFLTWESFTISSCFRGLVKAIFVWKFLIPTLQDPSNFKGNFFRGHLD